ncbi:hypothetical protein [Microtetraspora sp. NBRC 13810]|uniref:hypothetical protein n=1 Tax=Microtetraspora sp. NBRC 13810 TaxID=3030990 RepID=UPI0025551FBD|nr:hypothetical protein [Microtetraspora sp. NBRC 13810]
MSIEEKRVWIYAMVAIGVPVVYFAIILGRLRTTGADEIAYAGPMLTAIVVAIAANVGANIVAGMLSPKEANRRDERDADIQLYGRRPEFYVLAVGVVAALGLTLAEFAHFWIANTIYLAFVLSALTSSAARIVAYRRGF